MAAFSPCQSFWVNCQICWCWGSFLRRARDVDFHKHLITWPNWTTGRAGDICREVNHYQVQKGGLREIHCDWEKSGLESSQIESVPWSQRSLLLKCHGWWERYQHTVTLHGDNWNHNIRGRESWDEWLKAWHVILQPSWKSDLLKNERSKSGTREFIQHLTPHSLEKKGQWKGL